MEIAATTANVLMVRTFSKIHGLAALRLGWAYGPRPIIDAINRIRGPFNVNSAALEAGRAAIADEGHVEASVAHNEQWLGWLARNIAELGIRVTPSVGNFLLLHFPGNRSKNATAADAYLTSRGLILRGMTAYGMPDALRLSVGTEDANRAVVAALAAFMREPANA
jgi:histidinol-phosphate aminotransferase